MANIASTQDQKGQPTEAEQLEVQVLELQDMLRERTRYSITPAASELAAAHQKRHRIVHTLYSKASERMERKDAV
jgi:hypothetical protein